MINLADIVDVISITRKIAKEFGWIRLPGIFGVANGYGLRA
jgi:hypothetical protein